MASNSLQCNETGICQCQANFSGDKCEQCKTNFAGEKCDRCADGHINFPNCITGNFVT